MVSVHGRIVGAGRMFGALGSSAHMKAGPGTRPQEVGRMPKGRGMPGEVGAARVHRAGMRAGVAGRALGRWLHVEKGRCASEGPGACGCPLKGLVASRGFVGKGEPEGRARGVLLM